MHLRIVFEPSDESGYTVYAPTLPGCISEGDTLDEARQNIREAIAPYLERAEGLVPPAGGCVVELTI
jgi:predicted RNase H-like HicB family nuclease